MTEPRHWKCGGCGGAFYGSKPVEICHKCEHRQSVITIAETPMTDKTPPHLVVGIVSARQKAVRCGYYKGAR